MLLSSRRFFSATHSLRPEVKLFFEKVTSTAQYVVSCPETRKCAIIDPVCDFNKNSFSTNLRSMHEILKFIKEKNLTPEFVLETHVHADHLTAADYVHNTFKVPVGIGANVSIVQRTFAPHYASPCMPLPESTPENPHPFHLLFRDGDKFKLGNLEVSVLHTPGHTPACVTYRIGDSLFTGDTIFMPDSGTARCDFPGGSAETLWDSIRDRLLTNDHREENLRMFVGHDYQPNDRQIITQTTVQEQWEGNIHVNKNVTRDEFLTKRRARDATLELPGLIHVAIPVNLRGGLSHMEETAKGQTQIVVPIKLPKD